MAYDIYLHKQQFNGIASSNNQSLSSASSLNENYSGNSIKSSIGVYSVAKQLAPITNALEAGFIDTIGDSRLKRNIGYGKQLGGIGLTAATLGAPVAVGVALIAFVADGVKRDYSEKKSQSDSVFNIKTRGVRVNNFTYGGGYYG